MEQDPTIMLPDVSIEVVASFRLNIDGGIGKVRLSPLTVTVLKVRKVNFKSLIVLMEINFR